MIPPVAVLLAAAALAVCADQATKAVAGRVLADGGIRPAGWRPAVRWTLNARASPVAMPLGLAVVVWVAAHAVAVLLTAQGPPRLSGAATAGLGLVLGGATGNLADRVRRGAVVDLIAIGPWPPFNLADAAMVIGAALLLVGGLL